MVAKFREPLNKNIKNEHVYKTSCVQPTKMPDQGGIAYEGKKVVIYERSNPAQWS